MDDAITITESIHERKRYKYCSD